jgi:hypothetical protein
MSATTMGIISAVAVVVLIPVIKAVIKALRARKTPADIVADALEAAVDGVEKKIKK